MDYSNYLFFISIRSVHLQRNSLPKTMASFINRVRWVLDKLADYLRSDTKDGKKSTFLDSGHYMLSNGELSKNYSPPEVVKAHAIERSVLQH